MNVRCLRPDIHIFLQKEIIVVAPSISYILPLADKAHIGKNS